MNVSILIIFMIVVTTNAEKFTKDHKELLEKVSAFMHNHPRATKYFETPEERSERINSALEKIVKFFNVVGQIDNLITEKTKSVIKTLNAVYDATTDPDSACQDCDNEY